MKSLEEVIADGKKIQEWLGRDKDLIPAGAFKRLEKAMGGTVLDAAVKAAKDLLHLVRSNKGAVNTSIAKPSHASDWYAMGTSLVAAVEGYFPLVRVAHTYPPVKTLKKYSNTAWNLAGFSHSNDEFQTCPAGLCSSKFVKAGEVCHF